MFTLQNSYVVSWLFLRIIPLALDYTLVQTLSTTTNFNSFLKQVVKYI